MDAELILLGTQAGPPPTALRMGIASALRVNERVYVVDCGRGAVSQYVKAGLRFSELRSIFVTHLHPDHVADYFNFIQLPLAAVPPMRDALSGVIDVWGPSPAGALPVCRPDGDDLVVPGDDATPGIRELTELAMRAFSYGNNILMRENPYPAAGRGVMVHELPMPEHADALRDRAPSMEPMLVMEDREVRVTACLVSHGPVFPAYALRFDGAFGSVTFSGDTGRSENLIRLAKGSDVLVHEAVSDPRDVGMEPHLARHMLEAHVLVSDVGKVAEAAGAKTLVLSHITDFGGPIDPGSWSERARDGYSGAVIVGEDLMRIPLCGRPGR